jgi:CBS domain containing-hemolysin-like protein
MDPLAILIIAALIALNGLFVAAEFAIVGVPRTLLEGAADRGNATARVVLGILKDARAQDRFIATAQLGITLSSLGLGMYGEHALALWIGGKLDAAGWAGWIASHTLATILSIAILTYFHIVLGEMVPKSLALQKPQGTVLWITPLMRAIQTALWPLVVSLNGVGNGILRIFGVHRGSASHEARTPEELAYIVRESQAGGLLRSDAARVVQELLDFGNLTAGEVMIPRVRVAGIPLGASVEHVAGILQTRPHSRYPVYEDTLDRIVGVLHARDLLRRLGTDLRVEREHLRPVPFVPEAAEMDGVLGTMRRERSQLVVVMDEFGGTAGIITLEDLFEEVVGDIEEDGTGPQAVRKEGEGRWRVRGEIRLDELGAEIGRDVAHEDVDTVGGLIVALLGRPPQVGDAIEFDLLRLTVTQVTGLAVTECLVERVRRQDAESAPES